MSDKPLTDITFSTFDLHPALVAGLDAAGFTRCTPIQALTLPVALEGHDISGQAQTVWEQMAAASILQLVPPVILTFFVQRHIVAGMTMGAVK